MRGIRNKGGGGKGIGKVGIGLWRGKEAEVLKKKRDKLI